MPPRAAMLGLALNFLDGSSRHFEVPSDGSIISIAIRMKCVAFHLNRNRDEMRGLHELVCKYGTMLGHPGNLIPQDGPKIAPRWPKMTPR